MLKFMRKHAKFFSTARASTYRRELPESRSGKFRVFQACERFGIKPPGVDADSWDELSLGAKLDLLSYDDVRTFDENEFRLQLATIGLSKSEV